MWVIADCGTEINMNMATKIVAKTKPSAGKARLLKATLGPYTLQGIQKRTGKSMKEVINDFNKDISEKLVAGGCHSVEEFNAMIKEQNDSIVEVISYEVKLGLEWYSFKNHPLKGEQL